MNKRGILIVTSAVLLGVGVIVLARFWHLKSVAEVSSNKLQVAVSFYPLAEFAQQIGQDKVMVTNLTPVGAEPHDFDPSPQDIVKLQNSRVFIYNGAGLESWVDRVLPDLQKRGVVIISASRGIPLLSGVSEEATGSVVLTTDSNLADPHIWLDPALAIQEVETIKEGLIQADPANKDFYQANAITYQQKLRQLDQEFSQGLGRCVQKNIVTSHAAFGYVARHYHLTTIPIAGLSPDEEPSPQRLAQIAQLAKQQQIHYIFFETLISPRLSETIAQEIGAKTIVFNPLEGLTEQEMQQGQDYLSVQRGNLQALKVALECR